MTSSKNDIEISGSQMLYSLPEALHSKAHSDLRFNDVKDLFSVAAKTHLIPLLVGEFAQAALHYPIIFAGAERQAFAVMGLKEGQNLFFKDGVFEEGCYVPAYVRRYPFTLATADGDNSVVCIDLGASCFAIGGEGKKLFEDDKPTEFTNNAIAFLNDYEAERKRTQAILKELEETGIFEVKNTSYVDRISGKQGHVADYFSISEEKLIALPDAKLGALVRSGALLVAYAHLMSLQRWDSLIARRLSSVEKPIAPTPATKAPAAPKAVKA